MEPGSDCSRGRRLQQPVQTGDGVVLGLYIERRIQEFACAAPQRAQNRVRIVAHVQPDHMRLEIERSDRANQFTGLVQVRRQVQQDDVGLGLAHLDFQGLLRRIGLELRQDLERTGALQRGPQLAGQLAVGNDGQGCKNRPPAHHCALLDFSIRSTPIWSSFWKFPGRRR